jgi:hypothetical protein
LIRVLPFKYPHHDAPVMVQMDYAPPLFPFRRHLSPARIPAILIRRPKLVPERTIFRRVVRLCTSYYRFLDAVIYGGHSHMETSQLPK